MKRRKAASGRKENERDRESSGYRIFSQCITLGYRISPPLPLFLSRTPFGASCTFSASRNEVREEWLSAPRVGHVKRGLRVEFVLSWNFPKTCLTSFQSNLRSYIVRWQKRVKKDKDPSFLFQLSYGMFISRIVWNLWNSAKYLHLYPILCNTFDCISGKNYTAKRN